MKILGYFLALVFLIPWMVAVTVLHGWALSVLWGWFVVPYFGSHALSIPQAIGISLVAHVATHQYVPSKDGDTWMPIVTSLITPLIAIFCGWIVRGCL